MDQPPDRLDAPPRDACPHCGAPIMTGDAFCPECRNELPAEPIDTNPLTLPRPPSFAAGSYSWLVLFLSPLLCAVLFNLAFLGRDSLFQVSTVGLVGGGIGLVLGVTFFIDDWFVRKEIEEKKNYYLPEMDFAIAMPPPERYAVALLAVSFLITGAMWIAVYQTLPDDIVAALVVALALAGGILGYVDLRNLLLHYTRTKGEAWAAPNPVVSYMVMIGFWLVGFPLHFGARRRLGGRNYLLLSLLIVVCFLAPSVIEYLKGPQLPKADSATVLGMVQQILENSPAYRERKEELGPLSLRGATEISFDVDKQLRIGRVTVVHKRGEDTLSYHVEWHNRGEGRYKVTVLDPP
jgi:hypothetical protein